jgi:hypothetical protein
MARISDCAVEARKMTRREETHPERRESFMAAPVLERAVSLRLLRDEGNTSFSRVELNATTTTTDFEEEKTWGE